MDIIILTKLLNKKGRYVAFMEISRKLKQSN